MQQPSSLRTETLILKVTLATEDVEPGAAALLLATSIRRIASLTISARTSTPLLEVPGKFSVERVRLDVNLDSDPNCGAAYNAAVDDTALGFVNGCSQTNPSNSVAKPNSAPVCN